MEYKMEETCYEMNLPRENIHLRCFAHSIMNYRYHWHTDKYELSIVLHGTQEYCRGTETHSLSEDDLILTAPGNGHASMRQQPGTRALVQYRAMLKPDEVLYANVRKYLNPNDAILREKLKEYAKTGLIQ